jgi:hypothetical protein
VIFPASFESPPLSLVRHGVVTDQLTSQQALHGVGC